ncbi:MAG: DUF1648 domain-containing protein [Actinomycetota bacterium]|nr:DUF1648 domain-containing protein [Actinomycetota bacterium]
MNEDQSTPPSAVALWLAPFIVLAFVVVPQLALWSRLPGNLAIHWGVDGHPNGSAPKLVSLLVVGGLWVGAWIWALQGQRGRSGGRDALRNAHFIGGFIFVGQLILLSRNLDAPTWDRARNLAPLAAILPITAGILTRWIASRLLGTSAGANHPPLDGATPRTGRALWTGTARNSRGTLVFCGVGVGVGGLGLLSGQVGPVGAAVAVAVVVILAVGFGSARVTVGPQAVVLGLGPWGWPRRRVPLSRICRATYTIIEPMQYGGWGYRVRSGTTAVVIRKGQALHLELVGGRSLIVTVDGAEEGSGLVNHYLAAAQA